MFAAFSYSSYFSDENYNNTSEIGSSYGAGAQFNHFHEKCQSVGSIQGKIGTRPEPQMDTDGTRMAAMD